MDNSDKMNSKIEQIENMFLDDTMLQYEQDKILAKNMRILVLKTKGLISTKNYEDIMDEIAERIDKILLQKEEISKGESTTLSSYRLLIRNNKIEELLSELLNKTSLSGELKTKLEVINEKNVRLKRSNRLGIISLKEYENQIESILDKLIDIIQKT